MGVFIDLIRLVVFTVLVNDDDIIEHKTNRNEIIYISSSNN